MLSTVLLLSLLLSSLLQLALAHPSMYLLVDSYTGQPGRLFTGWRYVRGELVVPHGSNSGVDTSSIKITLPYGVRSMKFELPTGWSQTSTDYNDPLLCGEYTSGHGATGVMSMCLSSVTLSANAGGASTLGSQELVVLDFFIQVGCDFNAGPPSNDLAKLTDGKTAAPGDVPTLFFPVLQGYVGGTSDDYSDTTAKSSRPAPMLTLTSETCLASDGSQKGMTFLGKVYPPDNSYLIATKGEVQAMINASPIAIAAIVLSSVLFAIFTVGLLTKWMAPAAFASAMGAGSGAASATSPSLAGKAADIA